MYYGIIYWQEGIPSYRECQTEKEVWDVFNNAPQASDSTAQVVIADKVVCERYDPLD